MSRPVPRSEELSGPTRFEWPDEEFKPSTYTASFDDISYETMPLVKPLQTPKVQQASTSTSASTTTTTTTVTTPVKQESYVVSFEEIRRTAVKRPSLDTSHQGSSKKQKVFDLQAVKEYVQEHQLRKDLMDIDENSEDVDDDLAVADFDDDDEEDENENTVDNYSSSVQQVTPQKSILKSQVSHDDSNNCNMSTSSTKRVRFSLDSSDSPEGKENEAKVDPPVATSNKILSTPMAVNPNPENLTNHAKIITEVLKKYPHLIRSNKNVKLKIMQRSPNAVPAMANSDNDGKVVKSKVSYVVLKSDVAGKGKQGVVLKHGGHVEPLSELPTPQTVTSGAENTTGPWICYSCGTNEEPMNFETYYLYRRHLQDVHMEKIDARICEHCGHRASKRNLLLYHLYTRHNIPPPRNCQFPKCDQCEYVALSESLLIKHRNNHSNNKDFVCKVCNASFKSNGALQGHMQTNLHSDPSKKLYDCPFCSKPFVRNINLKAHIRSAHKEAARKLDEDPNEGEDSQEMLLEQQFSNQRGRVVEVPVINQTKTGSVVLATGMTVLAEAPAVQTLVPSSEAEALSNVASGIAASLGLADTLPGEQTVIVLDENQEYVLHQTEIVETSCTEVQDYVEETSITAEDQEYIIPDMIPEEQQYNNVQTLTENGTSIAVSVSDNRALDANQPTAPPPIHIAHDGEEINMVISDHDYIEDVTLRENSGERMMYIITQAGSNEGTLIETTQMEDIASLKDDGQTAVIPIQEGSSHSIVMHSGITGQLIRQEFIVPEELSAGLSEHIECIDDTKQSVVNAMGENFQIDENGEHGIHSKHEEGVNASGFAMSCDHVTEDQLVMAEMQTVGSEATDVALVHAYASTNKISSDSNQVRRLPTVQMADLVKEWDDFDDSCGEFEEQQLMGKSRESNCDDGCFS